jgi:GAF domain-containing protein
VTRLKSWLELLLADVPVEVLEERRQAGSTTDEDARRALLLHARLRDRSQRAAGLATLSEMAAGLASVRDLPELLGDIATQARLLLRTDVAYLAMVEEDVLRIRYFAGVLRPTAIEIRLSTTAGLAGRIASSGRAAWTDDYLKDRSIEHLPQADTFAIDEGLRSILGVPLHAGGRTLGVLFAAERARRPFTEAERGLLSALAGHAAVAVENARLLEAERAAADELRRVNDLLQASAIVVDRAIVLHDRLTDAVVRGGGPTEVVQALSDVIAVPVQLVDERDRPLAGPDLQVDSPRSRISGDERRAVVLPSDAGSLVLCPVVAADDYLGCLLWRSDVAPDEADLRLLERGAVGIALSLVHEREVAEAAVRTRADLLTALVEGGEPDVLEQRAAALRVDLTKAHRLAVVAPNDANVKRLAAEVTRRHDGLSVSRGEYVLVLVPDDADLQPLASVGTVAVSAEIRGVRNMPEGLAEARRCLLAALALGRLNRVVTTESLGPYGFLLAPAGRNDAAAFVRRTIGPLLDHDAAKGTALAATLEQYLAGGRQHAAAAQALHIHPNTLYQRLNRIAAVLGEHWRDPDPALDVQLALRLHRLSQAL